MRGKRGLGESGRGRVGWKRKKGRGKGGRRENGGKLSWR